jgi:receptor protein-tyrosine kinase
MSTIEKAVEKMEKALTVSAGAPSSQDQVDLQNVNEAFERHTTKGNPSPDAKNDVEKDNSFPQPTDSQSIVPVLKEHAVHEKLDLVRLRAAGLITPEAERSQVAEEFRMIKRPLLKNAFGQGAALVEKGNLIMISSGFPNEGKTFTSINLALSIASELDHTVLLVDADVARPAVTSYFGIDKGPGLVDYLLGDQPDLSSLLIKTDIPKLTLLPAGKRHHHSTELLASESMRNLLEELSERYPDRVIIFDSPPLLVTTEASVLASLVGQIVIVVESEKTTQTALKEALSLLDPDKSIGLVLNKSRQPFGSEYGMYYGYYGHEKSQ